jgi:hypothetical protein
MSRALAFWILMLIWFVFSLAVFGGFLAGPYVLSGGALLHFILFALLGWNVFGAPLRG